ncbi:MAG: FHA domain-containing protein [Acidimicrobiales bacterium]
MNALTALLAALLAFQAGGTVEVRDIAPEGFPDVSAIVRVLDADNRPVPGLSAAEFDVREDGVPVKSLTVRPSFREGGSLAVVLAIDTSGSMKGEPIDGARAAAQTFLGRLGPDDHAALVTFGVPPQQVAGFGPPGSITAVDQLVANGDTGLYDAINLSIAMLAAQMANARALVVMTDGRDDGSNLSFDSLRAVVANARVPIHTVGFQSAAFDPGPLRDLAAISGGSYRETANAAELATLYRQIADELLSEYRLTYRSAAPPGRHQLHIAVGASGVRASVDRTFDGGVAAGPVTAPTQSEPEGVPLLPILLVLLGVVTVVGAATWLLFRRKGRPLTPPAADRPRPVSGMVLEGSGVSIPITTGPLLVGRDPTAQVIIDDPLVSRRHATLHADHDGLWVEDLGSSNGTIVNGVPIHRVLMRAGDVLEIGDLRMQLRSATR